MSEQLNPLSAPLPAGPYSTAVRLKNGFLFLSGQLPLDLATGEISGTTVEEQAGMILKNIRNILKDCGYSIADIVKTVIYTTDLKQFGSLNTAYAGFMGDHRPVRTTVEVSSLPKGALVEIELTCWKEN